MKNIALLLFLVFLNTFSFAGKIINVDLTTQSFQALENGKTILSGSITSGRAGHLTPTGSFKVIAKERMHISNRYPYDKSTGKRGGAKMPYALRISNGGMFIHAGEMVDRPDSHGCIRLSYGTAMRLFAWADSKTTVKIQGSTPLNDEVNQMRLSIIKSKPQKLPHRKKIVTRASSVKWVEESLDYYDSL